MLALTRKLWNDESGATAVEYGLMVALIAVAIIAAVTLLGDSISTVFNNASLHTGIGGS
jgi:pilus assembly protein Flp/PilA